MDNNILNPLPQDVTASEKMQSGDDVLWMKILEHVRSQYPALMSLENSLPLNKLSIDGSFTFEPDSNDEDYRYHHVEPLLDQAADLLDRVLRDRADWEQLMVQSYNFSWDIEQFEKSDLILQKEVQAGMHTVDYKESYGANLEHMIGQKIFSEINKIINSLLKTYYGTDALKQKQIDDAADAAYATPWPNYLAEVPRDPKGQPNSTLYTVKDDEAKATIFSRVAQADAKRRIDSEEARLKDEERQSFFSRDSSRARAVGSEARSKWELANSGFKLERDKIARDFVRYKVRLASIDGNPLNYGEKTKALHARFTNDFRHAVARIVAVKQGLEFIYGYTQPLPCSEPCAAEASYKIDQCVLWVRTAINWLVRFSRVDQNYVLAVSVKQQLKGDWSSQTKAGSWTFEVPEDLFPAQRYVRLRGLGVCVVNEGVDTDLSSTWVATVHPPETSWCVHKDDKDGQRVEKPLVQNNVPPCRLGRVSCRYASQDIDVTGISSLHNVSPFGTWNVTLGKASSTGLPLTSIKDVVIDLHLAVHATK